MRSLWQEDWSMRVLLVEICGDVERVNYEFPSGPVVDDWEGVVG
jgi:hypothetical protein